MEVLFRMKLSKAHLASPRLASPRLCYSSSAIRAKLRNINKHSALTSPHLRSSC